MKKKKSGARSEAAEGATAREGVEEIMNTER